MSSYDQGAYGSGSAMRQSSRMVEAIADVASAVHGVGREVAMTVKELRRELERANVGGAAIDRIERAIEPLVAIDAGRIAGHFGGASPGGSSPGGSSPGGSSPGGSSPGGSSPGGSSPGGSSPGGSSPGGSSPGGSSPGEMFGRDRINEAFLDLATAALQVQQVAQRVEQGVRELRRASSAAVDRLELEVHSLAVIDRAQLTGLGGRASPDPGLAATRPRDAHARSVAPRPAPEQRGRPRLHGTTGSHPWPGVMRSR